MARTKGRTKAKPRARPRRPALGNDPFERGAAEREPASGPSTEDGAVRSRGASIPTAIPTAIPTSTSTPTATPTAIPTPTATPTATHAATATEDTSARPERSAAEAARSRGATIVEAATARVAAVERHVDRALDGLEGRLQELAARSGVPGAPGELREALARLLPAIRGRLAHALDVVRLLEPPLRLDRFGMDPRFAERFDALVELLYAGWWRVGVTDVERVPASGPVVVVANHAGAVPWDAFVLRHALRRDHPARRELRPLLDDAECDLPILGGAAIRYGAVRASPEAALGVLAAGDVVGVFPEGSAVARKPWRDRYRVQRLGRGGFVKVALRGGAPIVPCAIVGSEEASPAISRTGWLAERLGVPLFTSASALRLGTAALLPLPSRWALRFGAPIDLGGAGPDGADDPGVVGPIAERVRATLQTMLDEGVAARSSVYL